MTTTTSSTTEATALIAWCSNGRPSTSTASLSAPKRLELPPGEDDAGRARLAHQGGRSDRATTGTPSRSAASS